MLSYYVNLEWSKLCEGRVLEAGDWPVDGHSGLCVGGHGAVAPREVGYGGKVIRVGLRCQRICDWGGGDMRRTHGLMH